MFIDTKIKTCIYRMWVCFQKAVFVWACKHEDQAYSWRLCWNCHCILCKLALFVLKTLNFLSKTSWNEYIFLVSWCLKIDEFWHQHYKRRAGFWVLGESNWSALHGSNQYLCSWERWPGTKSQPLVWSCSWFPHLLHSLEPSPYCVSQLFNPKQII